MNAPSSLLAALILFTTAPALVTAKDIWHVSLAYGPSPSDRPPFSRDATLDLSALRYQIPIIVGSYLAVVALIGVCLITFGRRMRRDAQSGLTLQTREMFRIKGRRDKSPSTRESSHRWGRWNISRLDPPKPDSRGQHDQKPNAFVSFDPHVIQQDREARQDEMERIYAQIMAQEYSATQAPQQHPSQATGFGSDSRSTYHQDPSHVYNETFYHQQQQQQQQQQQHQYQHYQQQQYQQPQQHPAPRFPSQLDLNTQRATISPPVPPPASRPLDPSTPRQMPPPYSHVRQLSNTSTKSKYSSAQASLRGLSISSPIPFHDPDQLAHSPPLQSPTSPKSPRPTKWYRDTRRPPTPPSPYRRNAGDRPSTPFEDDSDIARDGFRDPISPRKRVNRLSHRRQSKRHSKSADMDDSSEGEIIQTDDEDDDDDPHITESITHAYDMNELNSPLPPPNEAPQRVVVPRSTTPPDWPLSPTALPSPTAQRPQNFGLPQSPKGPSAHQHSGSLAHALRANSPGTLSHNSSARSISRSNTPGALPLRSQNKTPAGSSTNTLPFRAFMPPPQSPTSGLIGQALSPEATKTTFLSPRRPNFLPGGMHAVGQHGMAPNTAALFSAGLATPYSPYMPFSPMTPVTPHLINRRERRQMQREQPRQAATEDDVVPDEKELWGDAY